jgi:hypothetical protein
MRRNIDGPADRLAVRVPTNNGALCHGNPERCGAGLPRRVIKNIVKLPWWKPLSVVNVD